MKAFIDEHRGAYGVEPICTVMQIAPSTYWLHAQRKARPELRPQRARRDEVLAGEVQRVWKADVSIRYAERLAEAGLSPLWATPATPTTTRWQRRSRRSTRPK